jgi:hypothetical protein
VDEDVPGGDLSGTFGSGCGLADRDTLLRRANWAGLEPERSSLILSKGMVRVPAISLAKVMLPPEAPWSLPVSWSPFVKMRTSGVGLGASGFWAWAAGAKLKTTANTATASADRGEVWRTGIILW